MILYVIDFIQFENPLFSYSLYSLYIGGGTVAAGASGVLVGGWITRKGDFNLKGNLIMLACLSVFNLFPISAFLVECSSLRLQGSNQTCNAGCHCNVITHAIRPGCGADDRNYLSPCYAGCRIANVSGVSSDVLIQS